MHFCSTCQNMYYIRIGDDADKLIYYCRQCGHEDTNLLFENTCVSSTKNNDNNQKYTHIINKYTKLDPTLPRVDKILCPYADCKTNTQNRDKLCYVIIPKYKEITVLFFFLNKLILI